MSQENVEIVRRMYDAFHRGDLDAALAYFDPDVATDASRARPDLPQGHGHEELRRTVISWVGAWDEWREEIEEMRDLGSRVLVLIVQQGRGKGSGIEVEAANAAVYELDRGKITRMTLYQDRADAFEAAGLSQ